jgi:hypothetical protein
MNYTIVLFMRQAHFRSLTGLDSKRRGENKNAHISKIRYLKGV